MKKIVSLFMTILMIVSVATVSFSQTALAKTNKGVTKYKITKVDKSKKFSNDITYIKYYKKVVLKGSSKSIKKINKVLNADCNKYMNKKTVDQEYKSIGSLNKLPSGMVSTLKATHTAKMKYNKNKIISISVSSYDSMGGVPNTTLYGFTYNVKSGKKLTLKNVTNYSKKKLRNEIIKKLQKKYGNSLFDDYKKYVKNVYKLPCYIKSGNKCVITFKPYTVTSGGTYSSVTIKSKYK